MTNEEWFKNMTTKELASWLDDIRNNFDCAKFCVDEEIGCGYGCRHIMDAEFFEKWLRTEMDLK